MADTQTFSLGVSSQSPPRFDSSTRALLDDFLDRQKKEKARFEKLKSQSSSASSSRSRATKGYSSSVSSASSVTPNQRHKTQNNVTLGRSVADLLPRGRSGKGGAEDEFDDDEDALIAQAEALADLERLNGLDSEMTVSPLRGEFSDDEDDQDDHNEDESSNESKDGKSQRQPHEMDVDTFRKYFSEKWQLSQFWYTSEFAYRLARCVYRLLRNEESTENNVATEDKDQTHLQTPGRPRTQRVGFMCCPAAYVAFKYLYPGCLLQEAVRKVDDHAGRSSQHNEPTEMQSAIETYLFEYDDRFSLLAPSPSILPDSVDKQSRFIHYDLNDPLTIPASLESRFDMLIVDPPYLNRDTNLKLAQTVKKIAKSEESKLLLITGQSISEQACEIYSSEKTGRLRRAEKLEIAHVGLKNDFGAWGNWDGVEDFGSEH